MSQGEQPTVAHRLAQFILLTVHEGQDPQRVHAAFLLDDEYRQHFTNAAEVLRVPKRLGAAAQFHTRARGLSGVMAFPIRQFPEAVKGRRPVEAWQFSDTVGAGSAGSVWFALAGSKRPPALIKYRSIKRPNPRA